MVEEEMYEKFFEDLCNEFQDSDLSWEEHDFVTSDISASWDYETILEEHILHAKSAKAKKSAREDLDKFRKFASDLAQNGWKKEAELNELKKKRDKAMDGNISEENIKAMNESNDRIKELEGERIVYARYVFLDRHPEFVKDFCYRHSDEYADVCEERIVPKFQRTLKKKMNECLDENEDDVAEYIGYAREEARERTRRL